MLDWLQQNKEWIFSGLGVSIVTSIITLFARRTKKKKGVHGKTHINNVRGSKKVIAYVDRSIISGGNVSINVYKKWSTVDILLILLTVSLLFILIIVIVLSTQSNQNKDNDLSAQEQHNVLVNDLNSISIGNTKQSIDDKFGSPTFSNRIDIGDTPYDGFLCDYYSFDMCVYLLDTVMITVVYDIESSSTDAFFITLLSNENDDFINLLTPIRFDNEYFCLGEISYYDIDDKPIDLTGYVSNGAGRFAYGEKYYYGSGGNYYDYYFATLDFGAYLPKGITINDFWDLLELKDSYIDDEVGNQLGQIFADRKSSYPNTLGVSRICELPFSAFFHYIHANHNWYDSMQIRAINAVN